MIESFEEVLSNFPWIAGAFVFCIGACVGSFLNVCIYRIPAGESIVSPPSHCACGKPIKWYLNLPVVSWFLLGGRASCCGRKLPFRYPLVESLTAVLYLCMWLLLPVQTALAGAVFVPLMIFCAFVDIDTMTLPDMATAGGALAGIALACALPESRGIHIEGAPFIAICMASAISSIVGVVVGAGATYCVRLAGEIAFGREAMGEGDVILAACVGAFCGWQGALFALFGGSVIGCFVVIPMLLAKKVFSSEKKKKSKDGELEIPFGPWIALGGVLYFAFFRDGIDAYFLGIQSLLFQ